MEFLLLPSGPSLLLLLLHAGAIRICEHQEDRIFGIPVFQFGCNIFRSSRGPPPSQCRTSPRNIPKPISVRNAEPPFSVKRPSSVPVQFKSMPVGALGERCRRLVV